MVEKREFQFDSTKAQQQMVALEQRLAKLNQGIKSFAKSVREHNTVGAQMENVQNRLARSSINLSTAVRKVIAEEKKANVQTTSQISNISRLTMRVEKLAAARRAGIAAQVTATKQVKQFGETAKKASDKAIFGFKRFASLVAAIIISRAISLITFQLREATEAAISFSIAIGELQTLSDANGLSFDQWAVSARKLSDALGLPQADVAEGIYQTLSNQVAKAGKAIEFTAEAQRLAVVGRSQVVDSVNLLTAAVNAFGRSTEDAGLLSAQFFNTVVLGRLRIEELGNTFGRVGILANQLGITIPELNAALATITLQGVKLNEAMTFLRGIFLKLIKPSEAMKDVLKGMGFETAQAAIEVLSFRDFMAELETQTQGNIAELGKLFTRMRAITGAAIFTGKGLELFTENLRKIQEESVSVFLKAEEDALKNQGRILRIELNKIKNFFVDDLGFALIRSINAFSKRFGGLDIVVKSFLRSLVQIIATVVLFKARLLAVTITMTALRVVTALVRLVLVPVQH